jgi:hypothetical protein
VPRPVSHSRRTLATISGPLSERVREALFKALAGLERPDDVALADPTHTASMPVWPAAAWSEGLQFREEMLGH